jgi:putative membrane protein
MKIKQIAGRGYETGKSRITTGIMAVIFLASNIMSFSTVVYAAEPTVSVDEAAYINLNYYGSISEVNIVKGVSLNGLTQFKDYGNYVAVSNMSTYDQPVIEADGVKWNLENTAENKRFYYNCKVKNDAIELPWTVDVSYKLNGVPSKAETLAGASGVIEININVKPNLKAKDYYKNNMLLQAAAYINMEDTYSLDAPGSQLQSAGTYKAVVFAALPGEEDTYTIRIGTKSFETKGITITMMPGTLKQLEDIKEIKDAKDTLNDSFDAIYTSMNDVLNTMDSMKAGLSELQSGTAGLEDARSTFSSGKDQMNEYADIVLHDLKAANEQLKKIIPYFKTAQSMIKDIRNNINEIDDSLKDLADPLDETKSSISSLRKDLKALDKMLADLNTQIEAALTSLGTVASAGGATLWEQAELQGWANIAEVPANYSENISSLLDHMQSLSSATIGVINITETLIDEINNLNDTLNSYYDNTINLLRDCQKLNTLLNKSIDSTVVFFTYTKTLLKTSGDKLNEATETSLKGMSDILEKSITGLGSIPTMRNVNNTINQTIDKEFDKFENENKFLNLDAKAKLISFTSDNNPTPASIQIIMRTKEINIDDKGSDNLDLETNEDDIGIMGRIKDLFKKILGVFHISL